MMSDHKIREIIKKVSSSATARTVSGMAGGNILAALLGVVGTFVQARFVEPSELGYFRGFSIATGYVFFLHLGTLHALQRFYPYYIGKNQKEHALRLAEVCQSWVVGTSAIVSIVFTALALAAFAQGNWRAMLGWAAQVVAVFSAIYGGYLNATYRSGHDFITVTKGTLISSIVNLFTLPFFLLWPYIALALRTISGSIVNIFYLHRRRPLRIAWRFDWGQWRRIVKEGLPIFTASYGANVLWEAVDKTIILSFIDSRALGLWSMSLMFMAIAVKIPQAIVAIYIPRVMETFGRNENVGECVRMCVKPMAYALPLLLTIGVTSYFLLPLLVPILTPKYIDAVDTIRLMLLMLPIAVMELPGNILVAMKKTKQINFSVYTGMAIYLLTALAALKLGFGLHGIVCASICGKFVRISINYLFIFLINNANTKQMHKKPIGKVVV